MTGTPPNSNNQPPSSDLPPLDAKAAAELDGAVLGSPSVGRGVPRVALPRKEIIGGETEDEYVDLDGKTEWSDKPTFPDQLSRPNLWKYDKRECKIFDLSNEPQLKEYNELQTRSQADDTNLIIIKEEQAFSRKTDSWKVNVMIQYVKYKVVVKKSRT